MNTDAGIEVFLGHAHLHGDAESLSDLASVWRKNVEAEDAKVVELIANDLDVAHSAFWAHLVVLPFERLELGVVATEVLSAVLFRCIFFGKAAAAVFQRSEDCSWDADVVHLIGFASEQPSRE